MASAASLQFGQQLVTSLIPAAEGGIAVSGAAQAVLSPLSVWFALVLLLNGAGGLPRAVDGSHMAVKAYSSC